MVKMKMKRIVIIVCMILAGFFSHAQVTQEVINPTAWLLLNENIRLNKKLTVLADQQLAFSKNLQNMQHLVRAGINCDLTNTISFVPLGYAYTWNYRYGNQPVAISNNEHTVWQQVGITHRLLKIKLVHRLRLEERFIQNNQINGSGELVNNGYSLFQYRLRYRLMTNFPLIKPLLQPGALFLNASSEGFWSWGDGVTYHAMSQWRSFVGVGYQMGRNTSLTAGPYDQWMLMRNGSRVENNVGIIVQMNYQFSRQTK